MRDSGRDRGRAWRRAQRRRMIERRVAIVREAWREDVDWLRHVGKLAKWNLRSGCACEERERIYAKAERARFIANRFPRAELEAAVCDLMGADGAAAEA